MENLEEENLMSSTEVRSDGADRIIESLQDAEDSALEAVRKFLDTVNGVFPDVGAEGARARRL